jgi:hypothetical protein
MFRTTWLQLMAPARPAHPDPAILHSLVPLVVCLCHQVFMWAVQYSNYTDIQRRLKHSALNSLGPRTGGSKMVSQSHCQDRHLTALWAPIMTWCGIDMR